MMLSHNFLNFDKQFMSCMAIKRHNTTPMDISWDYWSPRGCF